MNWNASKWAVFVLLLIASAAGGAEPDSEQQSVADKLQQHPELSVFTAALEESGYWELVETSESLTVFAPTNFSLQRENSQFLLESVLLAPENTERLADTLAYHIILGVSDNIDASESILRLTTLSGECLPVTTTGSKVMVGPEASVEREFRHSNGVIYTIDHLLWSPFEGSHCDSMLAGQFPSLYDFGELVSDGRTLSAALLTFNSRLRRMYEQDDIFTTLDEAPGRDFVQIAGSLRAVEFLGQTLPRAAEQPKVSGFGTPIRDDKSLDSYLIALAQQSKERLDRDRQLALAVPAINSISFERYTLAVAMSVQ